MAKLSDMFPSKWMKAEVDVCEGEDAVGTITDVTMEQFDEQGKKVDKPVLHFKEFDKPMVCNKTNAVTISKLYGDETDDWIGKRVRLFSMQVKTPQGGMVDSICVRNKAPLPASGKAAPRPAARVTQEDADEASREHARAAEADDEMSKVPF